MTKIKVPTCGELNAIFDGLVIAMGFGFVGVDSVSVRVCVFFGGREWAMVISSPKGVAAMDAAGTHFDAAELTKTPHVFAETSVSHNDQPHLTHALASATLEDLQVQLESHGMQGGTVYMT